MDGKPKKPLFPAADVLQRLFENSKSPLAEGFQRWKLEGQWENVVGPTLAKHSRPVRFDRGTLIIEVANSVWMNEVRFLLEEIKYKINHHMGKIWVDKIVLIHK
jgi:predicted nucleic acid-binding Zn ribbon protein